MTPSPSGRGCRCAYRRNRARRGSAAVAAGDSSRRTRRTPLPRHERACVRGRPAGDAEPGRRSELPPFDIYQAYVEGWDAFWHGDARRAKSLFLEAGRAGSGVRERRARRRDAASNSNDCSTVDSLARALNAATPAIDRIGRLSLQIADSRCRGRNDEMLRLTLERADLAPGDASAQMSAATAALWANRPARVVGLLQRVDPAVDLAWSTDSSHFAYWGALAEADHMLGRHREELVAGNRLGGSAPLGRIWIRSRRSRQCHAPARRSPCSTARSGCRSRW